VLVTGLFKPSITDDYSLVSVKHHIIAVGYETVDVFVHVEPREDSGLSQAEVEACISGPPFRQKTSRSSSSGDPLLRRRSLSSPGTRWRREGVLRPSNSMRLKLEEAGTAAFDQAQVWRARRCKPLQATSLGA
jgi:hypothetical protein